MVIKDLINTSRNYPYLIFIYKEEFNTSPIGFYKEDIQNAILDFGKKNVKQWEWSDCEQELEILVEDE